jgi:phage baseplate assembly protein W
MVKVQTTTIYGAIPHKQHVNVAGKLDKVYGVAWPVGAHSGQYFTKASGYRLIRANIIQLLETGLGERLMLPSFGTNLKRMLFENINPLEVHEIREQIIEAYAKFMPKLEITNLTISPINEGDGSNTPYESPQYHQYQQEFQATSNAYGLRLSATYPDLDRPIDLDIPVLTSGGLSTTF